jgi:hypothetical protein
MNSAARSVGGPSSISTEVASMLHTKIGSRPQVIPGARIVNTVTSMLRAFRIIAQPVRKKAKM